MNEDIDKERGLNETEVAAARAKFGTNTLTFKKESGFIDAIKELAQEPMVILLLVTSAIYFISGKVGDGIFMAAAIVVVSGISLYQNARSRNALAALKDFTHPRSKVIRSGELLEIKSEDLVVGDLLRIEEGTSVSADGAIISSNDFSVNESILTGESLPVFKDHLQEDNLVFQGTTVATGLAIVRVMAIGNKTRLGKIGKSLESIEEEKTPLELQINDFVKKMVIAGAIVFVTVWLINYLRSHMLLDSLLKALTLAMSILPEEIPVAFTTFMALGAWRLMKLGVVVKEMKTVETLGSASVICVDKTGTITENKMTLAKLFTLAGQKITGANDPLDPQEQELITLAMWASEPIPFDPMEVALHEAYLKLGKEDMRPGYKLIHEYPLGGIPPMMTHVHEDGSGSRIIAAKGAPEAIMAVSSLPEAEKDSITAAINALAAEGYRILGVGEALYTGTDFPATQQELKFAFKGLVAFYDPPKKNIETVLQSFYNAGIAVKIITGDNAATTQAVAQQIHFKNAGNCIGGDELMALTDDELAAKVKDISIFTRMYPDAKLRVINALKAQQEIVAMTGDGVNDGPALKAAHIGIAMGKKGTEIAKQAASLILLEDDLSKMVDAVAMGRRIYTNLKKAIRYIISIHVPIILVVFIPLALGWKYPNIFSPLHIIFLELIMGPTCSIIFENEPMEKDAMKHRPRAFTTSFFQWRELATSLLQGLVIAAVALLICQYAIVQGINEAGTRTMVFAVLIVANIFLTLVNRSFHFSVFTTMRYKNNLVPLIISATVVVSALLLYITPFAAFFGLVPLAPQQLLIVTAAGFLSVIWYEIVKWRARIAYKTVDATVPK